MILVEKKPQLYEISSDGKLIINWHEGQAATLEAKRRFVLMLTGHQAGKTCLGPWWLLREIERTASPEGDNDYLAVTTSYPLFGRKMLPEIKRVFISMLRIGRYWSGERVLELRDPRTGKFWANTGTDAMWGRIMLASIGAPSQLEAATAKAAWLDELGQDEWDVVHWEAILRRLSLHEGRVLGTTTPYNRGWVMTEIYNLWLEGDPDYDVIQFSSTMNPAFPKREFERARRTLPDWRFHMFYGGRFAHPIGLIYNVFDEVKHLADNFDEVPDWWYKKCGIDPGGANLAQIWITFNPKDGRWYAYDEYLGGGVSTPKHVDRTKIHDADALSLEKIEYYGGAPSEGQFRDDWEEAGIEVEQPPVYDVEAGISRIIELINEDKFRVCRSLVGLRHELSTYRRKMDDEGNPTNEIVKKRKFHRLDALRYEVVSIDETGKELEYGESPTEDYRG